MNGLQFPRCMSMHAPAPKRRRLVPSSVFLLWLLCFVPWVGTSQAQGNLSSPPPPALEVANMTYWLNIGQQFSMNLQTFLASKASIDRPANISLKADILNSTSQVSEYISKIQELTEKIQDCLMTRIGPAALKVNLTSLLSTGAHEARRRRLQAADATTSQQSYMVVVDDVFHKEQLYGLSSRPLSDINVTRFEVVGGSTSCFIVHMTPADALKISSDSRVASTIPLYSNLKFESPKADVSSVAGDINLSDPFRSKFELPASFQLAMDKDNTTSSKTLSLTVVLGDGEDMGELLRNWEDSLKKDGITNVTFRATDAGSVSTKYLTVDNIPYYNTSYVANFLAKEDAVNWVEVTPKLVFFTKWAKGVTQTGDYKNKPLTDSGLDGTNQIIGVADTGLDAQVCFIQDTQQPFPYNTVNLNHRKVVSYIAYADNLENWDASADSKDPIGHGTHVSSTIVGNSLFNGMSDYNGLAPKAKVAFFDIAKYDSQKNVVLFPPGDLNNELFSKLYKAGAKVQSMSWGSPDSNCYSSYAVMVDEFMWNHPDALVVFAAGNSGAEGDYSVVTPSTAKNCLTVGASYNMMQSSFQLENNINYVAYFSSSGPTSDGRLKPEVVAPGYYITSAKAGDKCGVVMSRGTSMATPVVAANAALIRQYLMEGRGRNTPFTPSGALLKAMLVHSTQAMTAYEDQQGILHPVNHPDEQQGYGRIQLDQVLDTGNRFTLLLYGTPNATDTHHKEFKREGDVHEFHLTIANNTKLRPLRVTLAWTDRPAAASSCQRSSKSVLVNNLDLKVITSDGEALYPISTGGQKPDTTNNVEQITVDKPLPKGNYTIQVSAKALATAQNYALVVTGQFDGFAYNETLGAIKDDNNVWSSLKSLFTKYSPAFILLGIGIAISLWLCMCCHRRKVTAPDNLPRQPPPSPAMVAGPRNANPPILQGYAPPQPRRTAAVAPPESPAYNARIFDVTAGAVAMNVPPSGGRKYSSNAQGRRYQEQPGGSNYNYPGNSRRENKQGEWK